MRKLSFFTPRIALKANTTDRKLYLLPLTLIFTCAIFFSCLNPLQPVDSVQEQKIKAELEGRSFRQFW